MPKHLAMRAVLDLFYVTLSRLEQQSDRKKQSPAAILAKPHQPFALKDEFVHYQSQQTFLLLMTASPLDHRHVT